MSYPYSTLGADSYGPPAPGQTYQQFQSQMSAPVALGIGSALALVNPLVGLAVGVGLLLASKPATLAPNRPSYKERKGGH